MEKILVSACLLGENVRYDGGAATIDDAVLRRWLDEGRIVSFCPEVAGGLGTPRPRAERRGATVLTENGRDVTEAFERGAALAVERARECHVRVAVLKDGSPSCGSRVVHDGTFSGRRIEGTGVSADALRSAGIRVFSDCGDRGSRRLRVAAGEDDVTGAPAKNSDLHGSVPEYAPVALLLIDVINDLEFEGAEALVTPGGADGEADLPRSSGAPRAAGIPVIYVNDNFGRWQSDFRKIDAALSRGRRARATRSPASCAGRRRLLRAQAEALRLLRHHARHAAGVSRRPDADPHRHRRQHLHPLQRQ